MGTTSLNISNTTLPLGSPPMEMSKKQRGKGPGMMNGSFNQIDGKSHTRLQLDRETSRDGFE